MPLVLAGGLTTTGLAQDTVGTGIASTGRLDIHGSVTIGYTPEQLRDLMADQAKLTELEV